MIGKKVLWFVAATFVSFLVFAGIALPIEATDIFKSLTDRRLTACAGQSVIATGEYEAAVQVNLAVVENEELQWQALGIDSYCIETRSAGMPGSITMVTVVRDGDVDGNISNCFPSLINPMESPRYCMGLFMMMDDGFDQMSLQAEWNSLRGILDANVMRAEVVFDSTYHIPTFIFYNDPRAFDNAGSWELISFVPLQ